MKRDQTIPDFDLLWLSFLIRWLFVIDTTEAPVAKIEQMDLYWRGGKRGEGGAPSGSEPKNRVTVQHPNH